jgi:hypothetical protein
MKTPGNQNRKSKRVSRLASAVAALALVTASAPAQTPAASATDEHWHFIVGLYAWLPAIEGTLTVRDRPPLHVDLPFWETYSNLKFNITGHFEARRERVGLGLDMFYVHLGVPLHGEIPQLLDASVNLRQYIGEGFGFYRVAQGRGPIPWTVDFLGGVRYWDTNTRLQTSVTDGSGKTVNWVDGFGGLRFELPITSGLSVLGRGDVGAGGAKLDWSASGDLAFCLGKGWVMGAGYKTLNVDYDKQGATPLERRKYDLVYKGPRAWIAITW